MKLTTNLGSSILAVVLSGCAYVTTDDTLHAFRAPQASAGRPAERVNVSVALDCLPTCALVGGDLAQTTRAIVAAYRRSGRFTVTPSDDVSRVVAVTVSITREEGWLAPAFCQRTFGFLPASWHDHVRMVTTLSGREGITSKRIEHEADVEHYCHLFFLPALPFSEDPGALERTIEALAYRTALEVTL